MRYFQRSSSTPDTFDSTSGHFAFGVPETHNHSPVINGAEEESRFDFGTVICGGGPAGLGPLVAAARRGEIGRVLDTGVLVAERGRSLGGGSIGDYKIRGNSFASAFLECLETTADGGLLDDVRGAPATHMLERIGNEVPPLNVVGEYLHSIGAAIGVAIEVHPASCVALGTQVVRVRLRAEGGVAVELAPNGRPSFEVSAQRALLTLGGQPPRRMLDHELLPGIALRDFSGKVVHSSAIVGEDHDLLAPAKRSAPARVAIIGGAHSAWSVAWSLMRDATTRGIEAPLVWVLHRNPVRLFYLSAAEACADGYDFDPVADICPLSGRVNRFSGLRGDARDLARSAFGLVSDQQSPEGGVSCLPLAKTDREAIVTVLEDADLIVSAIGYDARLPQLLRADGEPLRTSDGDVGLRVSTAGELLDVAGKPIPELLAYGLGAGFEASPEVGGEPSASTRADGVWLYHHDVGDVVLDRMLQGGRERLAGAC